MKRGRETEGVEAVIHVALVEPTGVLVRSWNSAILLVLLTKTAISQSLEIERLGARLDAEKKERKEKKR